ncbi:MAG: TetR/AcrR family transcriptional regulator [Myxococcales bacterium]|nr:TetR/AcrR family transcriptional regulator [Myxococcales bacterium]
MKRSRDKDGTQAELLSAVQRVIEQDGVAGLGVNAVAREAGVDKVLIYRYFGGLEGLLTAFAESAAFWPTVAEIVVDRSALDAMSLGDAVAEVMVRYARAPEEAAHPGRARRRGGEPLAVPRAARSRAGAVREGARGARAGADPSGCRPRGGHRDRFRGRPLPRAACALHQAVQRRGDRRGRRLATPRGRHDGDDPGSHRAARRGPEPAVMRRSLSRPSLRGCRRASLPTDARRGPGPAPR